MTIRKVRPCITHCNFMKRRGHPENGRTGRCRRHSTGLALSRLAHPDGPIRFDRLRYFQPLKSLFAAHVVAGGGSDHMQKIGSLRRSIRTIRSSPCGQRSRKAKWYEGRLHPEEALSREQAIRFYTGNNAYILFLDDRVGSLETGKLADFIVLDRDLLTCLEDDIKDTQVLRTYIGGKLVFQTKPSRDR